MTDSSRLHHAFRLLKLWAVAGLMLFSGVGAAAEPELSGTKPLEWREEDLSERLMEAAHAFVERKIGDAIAKRKTFWTYDFSSREAYVASIAENRAELAKILGVVDERVEVRMERYGDDAAPSLVTETGTYRVHQARWPVFDGVFGEGLLIQPKRQAVGHVVVVPDASVLPEQMLGLVKVLDSQQQLARRLAESGFEVLVLQTVSRDKWPTEDRRLARADYTDREWIYRQAFHMGRHVIGYEVQRVLAAVDWFAARRQGGTRIGVVGSGEGGQIAFFAAALDERIDAALVSGYFNSREGVWAEPIYRNVFSRLKRFGDAEVAALVLPRQLVIEHCEFPNVSDQKGDIATPSLEEVEHEVNRIVTADVLPQPQFIAPRSKDGKAFSDEAVQAFAASFGRDELKPPGPRAPRERRQASAAEIMRRQQRAMKQLETHVQSLVRNSEHVRDRFFLYDAMPELAGGRWSTERRHPVNSQEKFVEAAKQFRRQFYEEAMGQFDEPLLPPNARTRLVAETDAWRAYDVVLDVYDGLFAWGVLVLPKDLKPGERRPVVVCQHGRQGIPRDTIDNHVPAYNDFAARLAERGFITFAPHNLYRGEDRYRWLDRKANSIGCTLFSFIIAQHDQILRWLDSLPQVDGDRIAFYGLSYGGETAVRVPTILEKYCLSICSGDFNQWTRKIAATDQSFSFMNTIEWEMSYWNLGHTFDYAEMTYLMAPRPFMVERGHHDRVGRDRWVAHEFAKVRWLYAQLGLADRVEIEFFQGGHSINGEGTFAFLHKHLDWREPQVDESAIRKSLTLYASFDERIDADFAGGSKAVRTRSDDPQNKGKYLVTPGYPERAFSIARESGIAGGALRATDVLPNRGRLFFPAAENIGYRTEGWSGSVSFWLKTNPDTMLKTKYCDPVQITERRAGDGGLWVDFPDTKPRNLRLGAFRGLVDGEKAVPEKEPNAPLIIVPEIGFQEEDWHHIAMTWSNFDTGKTNAHATLFIDGKRIGSLEDRDIAMKWDIEHAGIYFAVSYIGLLDEFAVFDRELSPAEVSHVHQHPKCLATRPR
jgi:dienelactone hydrolase